MQSGLRCKHLSNWFYSFTAFNVKCRITACGKRKKNYNCSIITLWAFCQWLIFPLFNNRTLWGLIIIYQILITAFMGVLQFLSVTKHICIFINTFCCCWGNSVKVDQSDKDSLVSFLHLCWKRNQLHTHLIMDMSSWENHLTFLYFMYLAQFTLNTKNKHLIRLKIKAGMFYVVFTCSSGQILVFDLDKLGH